MTVVIQFATDLMKWQVAVLKETDRWQKNVRVQVGGKTLIGEPLKLQLHKSNNQKTGSATAFMILVFCNNSQSRNIFSTNTPKKMGSVSGSRGSPVTILILHVDINDQCYKNTSLRLHLSDKSPKTMSSTLVLKKGSTQAYYK